MSRAKTAIEADFAGLDTHIREVVAPKLTPLEGRRKRSHLISRTIFFSLALVGIPLLIHFFWRATDPDGGWASHIIPNIFFYFFGLLGAGIFASRFTKGVKLSGKEILMGGVANHLGWKYDSSPVKPEVMEYLTSIKMHNPLSEESYEDAIIGKALGHDFILTEAHLWGGMGHGKGKNRRSFDFRGIILSIDFPKQVFGTTVLRRIANDLEWRKIKGLKPIGFASPEFTKSYEVFGSDQVEAYYLFSPDMMVTLLDAASDMGGTLAACIFWEGKLNLMISGENKFEMKTTAQAFANDEQFKQIKKDVGSVYKIIEKVEYYFTHRDPKNFTSG